MAGCCNYSRQPSRGVRMPVAESLVVLVLVLLLQVSCLATVAVATAGGDETTDPRACPPDQCAHITCPADSRPLSTSHEHQHHHHRIDDDDDADIAAATSDAELLTGSSRRPPFVYISNNQQQHHHHLQQRHHQPRHIVDPVDVHNNTSSTAAAAVDDDVDDTTTDSRSGRAARSVRHFKRRITIVPVDHHTLHKRSASALDEHNDDQPAIFAEKDTVSTAFNLTACCVRTHCTCDTTCVHNCEANEHAVTMRVASQRPGDCCDRIRCERKKCYSRARHQHFEHGQRWSENDCTSCECVDGEHKCQATMCRPLPCKHKVQVPGECCQRCDESRSEFCPGQTNCGLACRLGFVEDAERGGCKLCRCVRRKTTAATTTTTMTPTTAVTSVDATSDDAVSSSSSSSSTTTTIAVSIIDVERATSMAPTSIEANVATSPLSTQSAPVRATSTDGTTTTTDRTTSNDDDDDDANGGYLWTAETNAPAAPSPPLTGSDPTDPTVMSIRSYFEEHHLYIIVSATVFTTATVFAGLVWTYCKFSNKNSYNIVPNA